MNKTELINLMAEKTDMKKRDIIMVLDAFIESVTDQVAKGDKVTLAGFGVFESAERQARQVRSPQTGEIISVPAKTKPVFKPGKEFINLVNDFGEKDAV